MTAIVLSGMACGALADTKANTEKESQKKENKVAALDEEFLAFLANTEVIDEKVTDPLDMLDIDVLDSTESKDDKSLKASEAKNVKLDKETVKEER